MDYYLMINMINMMQEIICVILIRNSQKVNQIMNPIMNQKIIIMMKREKQWNKQH